MKRSVILLLTTIILASCGSGEQKQDNAAAAISLAGACIGFALPMAAAIYFTHDLLEMIKWAAITGAAQIAVFTLLRRFAPAIEQGHTLWQIADQPAQPIGIELIKACPIHADKPR